MKNIAQGLPLKKYIGNKHKDGGIMDPDDTDWEQKQWLDEFQAYIQSLEEDYGEEYQFEEDDNEWT